MKYLVLGSYAFTFLVLAGTMLFWLGPPGQSIQAGIDRGIVTSSVARPETPAALD